MRLPLNTMNNKLKTTQQKFSYNLRRKNKAVNSLLYDINLYHISKGLFGNKHQKFFSMYIRPQEIARHVKKNA